MSGSSSNGARLVLFDVDGALLSAGRAARESILAALSAVLGWEGSADGHDFSGKTDPQIVQDLLHANDKNSIDEVKRRAKANVTKAQPKVMLPVIDVPAIQLVVEEALVLEMHALDCARCRRSAAISASSELTFSAASSVPCHGSRSLCRSASRRSWVPRIP